MEPDWFGMYKPHSRCVPLLLSLSLPSYLLLWGSALAKKKLTEISIGQITKNPEVRHFIFLLSLITWGRAVEGRALGGGVRCE